MILKRTVVLGTFLALGSTLALAQTPSASGAQPQAGMSDAERNVIADARVAVVRFAEC